MNAMDTRQRVDLEALVVWAIKLQRADCDGVSLHDVEADIDGLEPARWSTDGVSSLIRRGTIGGKVDGGPVVRGVPPRIHADAEAVMTAVNTIGDRRRRGLVLHYGRAGFRPDWLPWEQRLVGLPAESGAGRGNRNKIEGDWESVPERSEVARRMMAAGRPIVDQHGRSVIERAERGYLFRHEGERRQVFARWCPLVEEPTIAEIRAVNETYAEWHAGMMTLLGKLLSVPPAKIGNSENPSLRVRFPGPYYEDWMAREDDGAQAAQREMAAG